jgi:hypothetical protein
LCSIWSRDGLEGKIEIMLTTEADGLKMEDYKKGKFIEFRADCFCFHFLSDAHLMKKLSRSSFYPTFSDITRTWLQFCWKIGRTKKFQKNRTEQNGMMSSRLILSCDRRMPAKDWQAIWARACILSHFCFIIFPDNNDDRLSWALTSCAVLPVPGMMHHEDRVERQ